MNYGLYLSASGVMVNSHRQDVLANNLANVNTAGYKPMFSDIRQRPVESMEDWPMTAGMSHDLLDRLGGGIYANEQRIAFKASAPIASGRDLDAAHTADNAFFVVEHIDPNTGEAGVRLTRAGQFDINTQGELVTLTGSRVLDAGGEPILIENDARPVIQKNGMVKFFDGEGNDLGADVPLQIVSADLSTLKPVGKNLFKMIEGDTRQQIDNPILTPGHYESSGTNAIQAMTDIISATKAATGNANMIRYHDQMLNASINTFARLA